MPTSLATVRAPLRASAGAFALAFALTAGCSSTPPPAPTVVVAVPTSAPSVSAAEVEAPTAVACPIGMSFLGGGQLRAGGRGHPVADFCLDITEVTAGAYQQCVDHGLCNAESLECDDAPTYGKPDLADHPVNCVSWDQADRYCRAAGKRLPTLDEWEWAAQARDQARRFAWGGTEPSADTMCWSKDNPRKGTCAVGLYPASRTPEGIDDLFGGVWEWLAPPQRAGVPNVARGGSWQNDSIDTLEGENAGSFQPGFIRNDVVGFRCAYDGGRPGK